MFKTYQIKTPALVLGLLVWMVGCAVVEPKEIVQEEDLFDLAEEYCKANPSFACGHVYACGEIELCKLDETPMTVLEAYNGPCSSTPKRICWWGCHEDCIAGCNALDGCFCPTVREIELHIPSAWEFKRLPDGWKVYD